MGATNSIDLSRSENLGRVKAKYRWGKLTYLSTYEISGQIKVT